MFTSSFVHLCHFVCNTVRQNVFSVRPQSFSSTIHNRIYSVVFYCVCWSIRTLFITSDMLQHTRTENMVDHAFKLYGSNGKNTLFNSVIEKNILRIFLFLNLFKVYTTMWLKIVSNFFPTPNIMGVPWGNIMRWLPT